MKKLILLSMLGALIMTTKSQAQSFQFITSFGVEQRWNIPYDVYYTIDRQYYGYDMVHAKRVYNGGQVFFDIVLQRGDIFVNVSMGPNGHIFRNNVTYNYPLHNHICNDFCGYHNVYYTNHRAVCHSNYHYEHNHVTYRPQVVVYGNGHNHHPKGNGYYKNKGNNKGYGHKNNSHDKYDRNNDKSHRMVYNNNQYMSRRNNNTNYHNSGSGNSNNHDRNPSTGSGNTGRNPSNGNGSGFGRGGNDKGNNGVRDHGQGVGRGKGNDKGQGKKDQNDRGSSNVKSNSRTSGSGTYSGRRSNN